MQRADCRLHVDFSFSALQRAENSSILLVVDLNDELCVSVLFSEPKIPQFVTRNCLLTNRRVSVLFSEPKIPQLIAPRRVAGEATSFSALQRAENSSIQNRFAVTISAVCVSVLFSEPKIPQCIFAPVVIRVIRRFSALQRAENSSISRRRRIRTGIRTFQCSSASRKFLNQPQRGGDQRQRLSVSVLFSEPKIPQ